MTDVGIVCLVLGWVWLTGLTWLFVKIREKRRD